MLPSRARNRRFPRLFGSFRTVNWPQVVREGTTCDQIDLRNVNLLVILAEIVKSILSKTLLQYREHAF